MDYYDYDSFCRPTKHSPLVDWPQHSFYQHSLLTQDHRKQDDIANFLTYQNNQQPRSYDALNLPHQQVLHSPYSAILQSLHHNSLLSPDHGTPRIKQEELAGFMNYPHHQQQRTYDSLNLPQQQVLHTPYSAVLQDSNFVSIPPQDTMEVPLSHALDVWDDDRQSSLSSLVESEMNEMTAMINVGNAIEDAIGDEDAEGDEEWEEDLTQQSCVSRNKRHFQHASSPVTSDEWEEDRQRSVSKKRRCQPASSSNSSSSPIPIPVPNLTKKSRGRRVPTMSSLEDLRSASSGAGKKRQGIGGKTARMYLCEVKGCGKCFARGEHLKRHVRSIHTYEKREVFFFFFSLYAHILTLRIYFQHIDALTLIVAKILAGMTTLYSICECTRITYPLVRRRRLRRRLRNDLV